MTSGQGFAPAANRRPVRYVRCARCQVPQPLSSAGPSRCVACGAPFQRWVAHPPPPGPAAARPRPTREAVDRSYTGPPAYRFGHPQWSFPPVVWRELPVSDPLPAVPDPTRALRQAAWLSLATAVVALLAAGAEIWRFRLLLDGRTMVLSGSTVRTSDVLVAAGGLAVVLAALLTVAFAVPALVRAHGAAARRIDRAPSRRPAAIVARLLVPVWNIYGAGQVVTEIDRMLALADADKGAGTTGTEAETAGDESTDGAPRPARASRVTVAWWLSWVASSALLAATLVRGLDGSLQAIADTVELHIAVDLLAAVVAGLGFLLLRRFAGLFGGRRSAYDGWVVQPPSPTRPLVGPAP